jgi:hypothetical protein
VQHFQLTDMVTWDEAVYPHILPDMVNKYGTGPFKVVGVRLYVKEVKAPCPFAVSVELSDGIRQEFPGEWFRAAYKPAENDRPIESGNDECPLAVLRSHPNFPKTLSPELEGVVVATNPAWPEETIKLVLQNFDPPCHTDWKDFSQERTEERNGRKAFVVYVRPGPELASAKQ